MTLHDLIEFVKSQVATEPSLDFAKTPIFVSIDGELRNLETADCLPQDDQEMPQRVVLRGRPYGRKARLAGLQHREDRT
jgi:hypothetical protein